VAWTDRTGFALAGAACYYVARNPGEDRPGVIR
jgi:hypothetical protein